MRAAVYARYTSENQRPESIEDQIDACRRLNRSGFSGGHFVKSQSRDAKSPSHATPHTRPSAPLQIAKPRQRVHREHRFQMGLISIT